VPSHTLRLDLVGVRALPLLTNTAGFSAIDGQMQARIDVRGHGGNLQAIMSSLSGAVDLAVQDGEIRNVNVAKMIRTLGANIVKGWQADKDERTDLSQLTGFFRIENGRASADNLRLLGPLVRVSGTGAIDLGAKTLNLRLDPRLVMSLEGQGGTANPLGFGVPIVAEGTWAEPRIYPNMAGILDNPEAAYARLNEIGAGLFGTKTGQAGNTGQSLMQSIDALIGGLGGSGATPRR
jgi:AsmA protein